MCENKKYKRTSNTHIDKCLRTLIKFLQENGCKTVGCCCGHGKYPTTIIIEYKINHVSIFMELFTQTKIPRIRRFYKKDNEGYYYIPEINDTIR